jgi:hypothetical protein
MSDLILFNAHIIHMDPETRKGRLVAVRAGKIMAVTGKEKLKELRGRDTKVIDCKGKTLVPGFIDAHFHLHAFAESLVTLDLTPQNRVRSVSDIQAGIRKLSQTQPPKTWIRGKGYHEFDLAEKRHPNRWDLDQAAPIHPVKLTHRSGHAHVLNTPALDLVGITKETADPTGGMIERNIETGEPTGLLYEMAGFLSKSIAPLDNQEMERGIKMADRQLLSLGITSVQDASFRNNLASWKNLRRWKEHGLFKPRVSMMLGVEGLKEYQGQDFSTPMDENQLRLHGVKIILDETTGQLHPPQSELEEMVLKIHGSGFQVAIHAIEEKAVISACSAIAYALKRHPRSDHRHRIEHCSLCSPTMSKRLASLGIMVVTQPPFIFYNGDRYLDTVPGGQLKYLYPIGTLIKSGVKVAGSSDGPVVPASPLVGIYAATSRMAETGDVVGPEEKISPLEAMGMYTYNAARAGFEERIKGSIAPGKMADLVILNRDPTRVPPDELKEMEVEMTILNGEVLWGRES